MLGLATGSVLFLSIDRVENKVCCRAGQTEPKLLLEMAQAMLSCNKGGDKHLYKVQPLLP